MTVLKYYNESTSQWEPLVIGAQGPTGPQGIQGIQGVPGADGEGVPAGGTTDQVLAKVDGADYNTTWVDAGGGGGFNTITEVTASNASFDVSGISGFARITLIGGGGGGSRVNTTGSAGGDTIVTIGGTTLTASGGAGGSGGEGSNPPTGANVSFNGGEGSSRQSDPGQFGLGGEIVVSYQDLTSVSTIDITIGAGGADEGTALSSNGFRGVVLLEYAS